MMLYNRFEFELVFCMVSTWDEFLTQYDDTTIHKVDHIGWYFGYVNNPIISSGWNILCGKILDCPNPIW